jgi:ribosomal protein S21
MTDPSPSLADLGYVILADLSARPGERTLDRALKILQREAAAAGVFRAMKRHEAYTKPAERRRLKHRLELARRRKALRRAARRAEQVSRTPLRRPPVATAPAILMDETKRLQLHHWLTPDDVAFLSGTAARLLSSTTTSVDNGGH